MGRSYETWKREAQEQQLNWRKTHGQIIWIKFELPSEDYLLYQLIGDVMWPDSKWDLTREQYEQTTKVMTILTVYGICDENIHIGLAFIYAFCNEDNQFMVPLFRVMNIAGDQLSDVCRNTYVDHLGNIYDNWDMYLKYNTWNGCRLIYPKGGCYFEWEIEERYVEQRQSNYFQVGRFNQGIDGVRRMMNPASLVCEDFDEPILGIPRLAPIRTVVRKFGLGWSADNTVGALEELSKGEIFKNWHKNALKQQNIWKTNMGNRIWDNFEVPSEEDKLFRTIEDALFYFPKEESRDMDLTQQEAEETYDIVKKLIRKGISNKLVRIGVAYLHVFRNDNSQSIVPLFRVLDQDKEEISKVAENTYVDHLGRIYKNWRLYLEDNTWDGCYLIYPQHGCYATNIVEMDCSRKGKFKQGIDDIKKLLNAVSFGCKFFVNLMHYYPQMKQAKVVVSYFGLAFEGLSAVIGVGINFWEIRDFKAHGQKPTANELLDILTSLSGNMVHLLLTQLNSTDSTRQSTDLSTNSSKIEHIKKQIGLLVHTASLYFSGRNITDIIADWHKLSYLDRPLLIVAVILLSLTTVNDGVTKTVLDLLSELGI